MKVSIENKFVIILIFSCSYLLFLNERNIDSIQLHDSDHDEPSDSNHGMTVVPSLVAETP